MTKLLAVFIALAVSFSQAHAETKVDLKSVTVSQAVQLLYAETTKSSYVVGPDIVADSRAITFRSTNPSKAFIRHMLSTLGYQIDTRDGVDFIIKPDNNLKPDQAQTFLYRPIYREPDYFVRTLSPLFTGSFLTRRQISASDGVQSSHEAPPGSAAALVQQQTDVVVFAGSPEEIKRLQGLIKQLDEPSPQLLVEGFMYQFSDTSASANALRVVGDLLDHKLGISLGASLAVPTASIKLTTDNFSAAVDVINEDSRFSLISSPRLRVADGESASFQSGSEVPVLGSVSYSSTGTPIQSVEYRDAGVILKIKPRILRETIRLSVDHQISSFSRTESGVNGSPTLSKKSISSEIELKDGEVVLLGGLSDEKTSSSSSRPFLSRLFSARASEKSKTETLLLLRVSRI